MANPVNPQSAPDPARSYERARPETESGQGRLDNNANATPAPSPDRQEQAVRNRQEARQINAEETIDDRATHRPGAPPPPQATQREPEHSMLEEQFLGEDEMPADIHDKRQQRHPRTEGRGGTP